MSHLTIESKQAALQFLQIHNLPEPAGSSFSGEGRFSLAWYLENGELLWIKKEVIWKEEYVWKRVHQIDEILQPGAIGVETGDFETGKDRFLEIAKTIIQTKAE